MQARLQKLLAAAGVCSRRQAEGLLEAGRVSVNGRVAGLGDSADPERDTIVLDGKPVHPARLVYWLLHKPKGVLSTTRDPHAGPGRPTVLELLPEAARKSRLFPVGRLDLDSEGLLLLTNDGDVTHALLHPSLGCEKEYRVWVRGRLEPEAVRRLARGLRLDDGPMAPCKVGPRKYDARCGETALHLTLQEGRKRQIRRALQSLGHPVTRLVRIRMGPLRLGSLPVGEARRLTAGERRSLTRFRTSRARSAGAASRRSHRPID